MRLPVRVQHWHYAVSYQTTFRRAIANRCFRVQAATAMVKKLPGPLYAEIKGDERSEEQLSPGSRANRMAKNDG